MKEGISLQAQTGKIKIIFVSALWVGLSLLFYFGVLEVNMIGHIEICLIISFAVILLSLHLFSLLRTAVRKYL